MGYTLEPNLLYVLGFVRPFSWRNWREGKYDYLIRLRYFCQVSHTALALNGMKIESWAPSGVRRTVQLSKGYTGCFAYAHPVDTKVVPAKKQIEVWNTATQYARKRIPYDWKGVLGRGVNKDWDDPAALFCSELTYQAFLENDIKDEHTNCDKAYRMPPHKMCQVSYLKKGKRINFY